jgi:hypothetical protein
MRLVVQNFVLSWVANLGRRSFVSISLCDLPLFNIEIHRLILMRGDAGLRHTAGSFFELYNV